MRLAIAFIVASLSGFIALSYEIVWVRVYNVFTEGAPEAFGYLLSAYLTGLAFGALIGRYYCRVSTEGGGDGHLRVLGWYLLAANLLGFLVVPAVGLFAETGMEPEEWVLPIFAVVAALLGTGLPLICHFGIPPDDKAGARLSYLYVGNIIGSAGGSLLTGFVLLDWLSIQSLGIVLVMLGMVVSGVLILGHTADVRRVTVALLGFGLLSSAIALTAPKLYAGLYEKLVYQDDYRPGDRFAHVFENKSGVVTVSRSGTVYGGGSYEGQFNVDPLPGQDRNRILRAYLVPALHPAPKEILVIGLGSGSWVQVLANAPDVERITVVEINPGMVEAARQSRIVGSMVENPKVTFIIDDGRRYMQRVDRRFDVIVQNTIAYWRGHATNLLSREYIELTRRRLKAGGIVYYNTTTSISAQRTGATVFPHALRYQNMLIASDSPIAIDHARWMTKMEQWEIDGEPVVDPERHRPVLMTLLAQKPWRGAPTWEIRDDILERTAGEPIITDDNMITEWWAWGTYP